MLQSVVISSRIRWRVPISPVSVRLCLFAEPIHQRRMSDSIGINWTQSVTMLWVGIVC